MMLNFHFENKQTYQRTLRTNGPINFSFSPSFCGKRLNSIFSLENSFLPQPGTTANYPPLSGIHKTTQYLLLTALQYQWCAELQLQQCSSEVRVGGAA